uniref:Uncharacterized protein n=1 Tax=Romanomermis culicivorax TaxID=13658 RepID=A0A915JU43_ROMCU
MNFAFLLEWRLGSWAHINKLFLHEALIKHTKPELVFACDALEQLNTPTVQITSNVPTVQTIDQIIGAVSDQFQAQQLCMQWEIQEQAQATNARFATLAQQMQQLISTTTAAAAARNNPPTPRPLPVNSWFPCQEPHDVYITSDTFRETKLALVYNHPQL